MQAQPSLGGETKKNPFLRILSAALRILLVVGIIVYVLYHLTGGFAEEMKTQTVRLVTEERTLSLSGTVIQSAIPVSVEEYSVVGYNYADGARVKSGAKIAGLYGAGADSAAVARIAELDGMIDRLQAAQIDRETTVADGVQAAAKAHDMALQLSEVLARGAYGEVKTLAADLSFTMARRNMILDGDGSIAAQLENLENERARLSASLPGGSRALYAPCAGYFFRTSDGMEDLFDYDTVPSLTPELYRAALSGAVQDTSFRVGRMVCLPKWYFVAVLEVQSASEMHVGNRYPVTFSADGIRVEMLLSARNKSADGSEVLLVFSTQEMPNGFDFARNQQASVVVETISGYRFPASALRIVDEHIGVYVRSGNRIKFRICEPIYESGAFVYVSANTEGVTLFETDEDETNDVYCAGISLYDDVIVGGAHALYPGEIVN